MPQTYHCNARTNSHVRQSIQQSRLSSKELSRQYGVSEATVRKWKRREATEDLSSRPHRIEYALSELDKELIRMIRIMTWMPLDDLFDTVVAVLPQLKRTTLYRTLRSCGISRVPEEKRAQAKKFKEYRPGYLHMDVTYLPMIDGVKYYLFVAIDRATRVMYYRVYRHRTANNAKAFLNECREFFPFPITHVLTDNGLEFTNRFSRGATKPTGNHRFDKLCTKWKIDHRLTEPFTPQTNGMVERANGIIKDHTIKVETYNSVEEMTNSLNHFLLYYLFTRRHGSLRKELKIKTPYEALEYWYNLEPSIFHVTPEVFKSKTLSRLEQPGGT